MTRRQAIDDFYAEQECKGNSPATVAFYRTNVEHFLRDTGIDSVEAFDVRTIRSWLLGHQHLSTASVKTYDRALRVLANWLHRRGYKDHNPMQDLPKPRTPAPAVSTFAYVGHERTPLHPSRANVWPTRSGHPRPPHLARAPASGL